MKLIVMKRGGEPGEIAINVDRVTHVRSAAGPFTDVYFGEQRVAVEGTFRQVVDRLSGHDVQPEPGPDKNWRLVR